MSNIDKVSVKGEFFNIVSPSAFGDYIETIGGACTNTSGYAKDQIFLAKTNDVQNLYQATQAISFGANIVVGTNCKRTTLDEVIRSMSGASSASDVSYDNASSHLAANDVQEAIDEVQGNVVSVNSALSNKADSSKAYQTDDTTETTLASDDVVPFYDTSATAKRKMSVQKFAEQLISNRNLLDNPWFTVNQRGVSSFATGGYPADRWDATRVSGNYTNNGISFAFDESSSTFGYIWQRLEDASKLANKLVTLSANIDDVIYSLTGIFPAKGGTILSKEITIGSDTLGMTVEFTNAMTYAWVTVRNFTTNSHTVKAVKLELGSVSTLAQDTAPNYQQELAKCQRYFVRLNKNANAWPLLHSFVYGLNASDDFISTSGYITLPVPMRAVPSIRYPDIQHFAFIDYADGALVHHPFDDTSSITIGQMDNLFILPLRIQTHGTQLASQVQLNQMLLVVAEASTYIDLSADL